ncbi:hypothetical protein [Enterococcus sp. LJL90]
MTRLEQSEKKLERLKTEYQEMSNRAAAERKKIPLGQPIIGRPDIYKTARRYQEGAFRKQEEIEQQEMRVAKLQKVEEFKNANELLQDVHVVGKSEYATVGAKTSVNNIDYFKNELAKLEQLNEEAKAHNKAKKTPKMVTYGTKITKLKRKLEQLESMKNKSDNQIISDKAQQLIDNELVTQWKKKPIYYFVKGLKKVAVELDESGNFQPSQRYYPYTETDKNYLENLLA